MQTGAPKLLLREGILDLREHPSVARSSPLRGPWQFENVHGNTSLRMVPDQWRDDEGGYPGGKGYGFYRLKILLPPNPPRYGIRIITASTNWRLWIDGRPITEAGNPHQDPTQARPAYRPLVIPLPRQEVVELALEISNWEYRVGGLWRAPLFGRFETLINEQTSEQLMNIGLVFGLLGFALLCLLAYVEVPDNLTLGSFALMSFLFSLRSLVTGDYLITRLLPDFPFELIIRLEYLTIYALLPTTLFFFYTVISVKESRRILQFTCLPFLPMAILSFFLPLDPLTRTLDFGAGLNLAASLTTFYTLGRHVAKVQPREVAIIFSASLMFFIAGINDFLYNSFILDTGNTLPWAQVAFVLMMSSIIIRASAESFRKTRSLTEELSRTIDLLQREIELKQHSIQEIYHQTRNNLQIINSLIGLTLPSLLDPNTTRVSIRALQMRVTALGLAQEWLLETLGQSEVDLRKYVQRLIELIQRNLLSETSELDWAPPVTPVLVPREYCRDLGLIMIEFVIRAVGRRGRIQAFRVTLDGHLDRSLPETEEESVDTDASLLEIHLEGELDINADSLSHPDMIAPLARSLNIRAEKFISWESAWLRLKKPAPDR